MLKIGWAKRDISTEEGIIIPGQAHIRISEGTLDPILVTALTVDDGKDYVIFLQSDSVCIEKNVLDDVRAEVGRRIKGIDPMKILMNASHTHTGPLVAKDNPEFPHEGFELFSPAEYRKFYIEMVCQAICESYESRQEGAIAYGYGFAAVAHSRRTVYTKDWSESGDIDDGKAKMYGDTNDETFQHYEAGTDSFTNFMFTFDKDEKLTGAIINVPCPSQNSELEWVLSADYWHDVRQEITSCYGDIYILPQCAAGGDLSPRQMHYKAAEQRRFRLKYADLEFDKRLMHPVEICRRKDIAQRIRTAFDEVYSWAAKEIFHDLPVVHVTKDIYLDRRMITDEEYAFCKAELEKPVEEKPVVCTGDKKADLEANTITHVWDQSRWTDIVNRYYVQKEQPQLPMELHVIRIGNIAFASNAYELYMDFQHRIQARSPFEQTFVIQLCGQPGDPDLYRAGYLATERGVQGRGYSATKYCNQIAPGGGQQLVDETVAELERIHEIQ